MRRRWLWPLLALAVAAAFFWAFGPAQPAKRTPGVRYRPEPLRDVPMTIGPAMPRETPPTPGAMDEGAKPPR